MKFTLEEIKRVNRLLKKEIEETQEEMKTNNSKEIGIYYSELLIHKNKIEEVLLK